VINRRNFLHALIVAAAAPSGNILRAENSANTGFGKLIRDPQGILDLPAGFSYTVVAERGEEMNDGLLVPGLADGMAAFQGDNGNVILVCNHENHPYEFGASPFGPGHERLARLEFGKIYDAGKFKTPGLGGTTTIHYDPRSRSRTHMHMSLIGTENNCAGGATPWGSWLSCEECFFDPGSSFERNYVVRREKKHGYIFEVPAAAMEPVTPVPLTDMGRFEHEAAAVNPASGYVYLTEDRHRSLLYRFVPHVAGRLAEGGRLQALAIRNQPRFDSRNWGKVDRLPPGVELEATWIDLDEADVSSNDLRHLGREKGAAVIARGEGICYADGILAITATIGGAERLGQVFTYRPSPVEGTAGEAANPGRFMLLAESDSRSVLRHADNITMSPWGDLILCEDTADHCALVGLQPDGRQYVLADNAYTRSELAGICFSPDGAQMFVNIQLRGLTLAITGPWTSQPGRAG
jgi:secreted PhoX family phosphatase